MGNRRIMLVLLAGILVTALLLWLAPRSAMLRPAPGEARASLFDLPFDALTRVVVERGHSRLELRRAGGLWELYAPFAARVDQGEVARLLDALEGAPVIDALSDGEVRRRELSLREFGLEPPAALVRLAEPEREQVLRVGAPTPLGRDVYVRRDGLAQILAVPAAVAAALPRTADDLRSRKLVHAERARVRSLEVRAPGRPFIKLSKESGTWRLVQPEAAPASDEKVEALLDTLYGARVDAFVWPTVSNVMDVAEAETALNARLAVYGCGADAAVQLQLQEAASGVPVRLAFGRPLDESAALSYVWLPGGDSVGAVSSGVARAFQLQPEALRDERLFFEKPDRVRRLEILFGDTLVVLAATNGIWRLQAPVSDVADQAAVVETVERLLRLKADRVYDPAREGGTPRDEPASAVSHVELVSAGAAWRFAVAPDDYQGAAYRFVFTNAPTVYRVASSNVPPALVSMAGLLSLRDKTVLGVPAADVRRVTVRRSGGETVTLQRDDAAAAWRLGDGVRGFLAAERLAAWLEAVVALRADRIEKLGLSLDDIEAHGLRAPWLEVSVDLEAADAVRKSLLVGRDAGFGKRYAMVRGLDVLFVLDAPALELLETRWLEPL